MNSQPLPLTGESAPACIAPATLVEALRAAAERGSGELICVRGDGTECRQSYGELLAEAGLIAEGLHALGIGPGDPVLLQLEAAEDFIPGFWGCVLAGALAVPIAVAPTFAQPNGALEKLLNAGRLLGPAAVLASAAAVAGLRNLSAAIGKLDGPVVDLAELRRRPATGLTPHAPSAAAPAVLLLTSGSTGRPKGVPLTHRNLLAMAEGTIAGNGFSAADVTLNWMALDHVGSVSFLGTMAATLGCTQVHVPTGYILQEPLRWLDLIGRFRATISWAPNFAFTLFLDRADAVRAGNWDLSSMRFLVNAGEPVTARTARKFIALLQGHGLPAGALRPAFGMSETASGITWSRGFTLEDTADDEVFVDLGPCNPGAEMRVVDSAGQPLPEGETGLLQLRGPSVFGGYFRDPEQTAKAFRDGWFETGDLALLRGGNLRIAGRVKDIIIVNGANFYCHEIEAAAESVPGLIKTFTAACAVRDAAAETDQLALFFCPDPDFAPGVEGIARALRSHLIRHVGLPPAYIVALQPSEVPKTEIGKIQRAGLRKAFESGAFKDRVVRLGRAITAAASLPSPGRRGDIAAAISRIWRDVLGLASVGPDETFFELGGHSLLVVQMQQRLQELMGRPVAVVELFECPTVRAMVDHFAKDFAPPGQRDGARDLTEKVPTDRSGEIAIIGIGLRFPGAGSPEEFWKVLSEGRETIRFFTAEEALRAGVDPELVRNPNHVRAAPVLEAPENFDAEFFRYSAKEARLIDPQQRVFLEVCWEAFEDAGYDPLTYAGKVGVFAAGGMNTYLPNNLWANESFLQAENGGRMLTVDSMSGFNIMITNDKDYLPMRVSYRLNLRGPSVNVQSACSSTLLTLHEACKSIRGGDCAMALAGGVSIKLPQHAGHLYSPGMLNSPDGHCRAYDARAEGTIFGNGAGVVLLKPLAAALADGDRVYAVVKGTACNNDGAGKVGFTAPSTSGQEDVCAEAIVRAGVPAESITFMEGHGTGTALGDPIEVSALSEAFRRQTSRTGFCALGSVKTNVGHLQIASGIAGLIKTALSLHHRRIPGTLHFEAPNPRIDFARTPFFVNRATTDWVSPGAPRRAGVNSLGIGGTNVHAVLEEAPAALPAPRAVPAGPWVLPLSARHPDALRRMAGRYADWLSERPGVELDDVAFTAQVGRASLPIRAAFVAGSSSEFVHQLREYAAGECQPGKRGEVDPHGAAWFFGADAAGLDGQARALWRCEPVFRAAVEQCLLEYRTLTGAATERIEEPLAMPSGFSKPDGIQGILLFAFEYGLADLLDSYGIEAAVAGGEGIGEFVAACRCGVFSLSDALRLVHALGAPSPDAYRRAVTQVEFAEPAKRMVGADHRGAGSAGPADAGYWLERSGSDAVFVYQALTQAGPRLVLEIGAGAAVPAAESGPRNFCAADFPGLLGRLFEMGVPVDWQKGRRARPARRVALPTYPWQHQAFWIEATDLRFGRSSAGAGADHPLLGRRWQSPRLAAKVFESRFDLSALPIVAEHVVHGSVVTPGALFLAQVSRQAADLFLGDQADDRTVRLCDIVFVGPMVVDPQRPRVAQTVFSPHEAGGHAFEVLSWIEGVPGEAQTHVTGRCVVEPFVLSPLDLGRVAGSLSGVAETAGHYSVLDRMEVRLGPGFRWIADIRTGKHESLLRLSAPAGLEQSREWHPGLVDSFLQAAIPALGLDGSNTMIPFRIGQVALRGMPDGRVLHAHAVQNPADAGTARCDVRLYDADGLLVAEALGFELRQLPARDLRQGKEPAFFHTVWEAVAPPAMSAGRTAVGPWLFLSDGDTISRSLQQSLRQAGCTVEEIPGSRASEAEHALRARRWSGVVYAWSLGAKQPSEIDWRKLLACAKAAAEFRGDDAARWIFLAAEGSGATAQAQVAGFATALAHEHPAWMPLVVEIDPAESNTAEWLPWFVGPANGESRLRIRAGEVQGLRLSERPNLPSPIAIRGDATYLVTGAGGALGQAVTEWLVDQGAKAICLTGRREPGEELRAKMATWVRAGVGVDFVIAEMGEADSVRRLVERAGSRRPLRGVFHAAGSLRDGSARQAEAETFTSVMAAKVEGAWALHQSTLGLPLDCFVMFSSIASLLGSAGQTNYAAANAFLDALALERQRAGLAGLSIQWGPWGEIGMTARLGVRDRERLEQRGLHAMAPSDALRALGQVLGLSGCIGVFAWNSAAYRSSLSNRDPAFLRRVPGHGAPASASGHQPAAASRDFAAMPPADRREAIELLIRETVAALLGLDSHRSVAREKGLFDLGIDSLTAIDLKDRLEKALGRSLRSTIAFDYPSAKEMAAHLAENTVAATAATAGSGGAAEPQRGGRADTDLSGLSAPEVEALLQQELGD